jgi:hypothetical protein
MNLTRWIDSRTPAPPPALAQRMRPALAAVSSARATRPDVGALDAALILLETIVADGNGSRTGAITLLAADALMTYAFEAAAEEPDGLEALAASAMIRIAETARHAR